MRPESVQTVLARIEERQKAFGERYERDQTYATEQRTTIVERQNKLESRLDPIFKVYERGHVVWWLVGIIFIACAGLLVKMAERIIGKIWP